MSILGRTRRICPARDMAPQKLQFQQMKVISLEMAVKDTKMPTDTVCIGRLG